MTFQPSARQMGSGVQRSGQPQSALQAMSAMNQRNMGTAPAGSTAIRPDTSVVWKVGDKACHGKWGIGTVVSVKGEGEEVELKIAFPDQGVKV